MRTNAVAHPWRMSLAWSAVSRAVGLSILGFIGWPWFVSVDDSAWKADSLVAAMALTAVVGGTWCLRRARTERRWRAAWIDTPSKNKRRGLGHRGTHMLVLSRRFPPPHSRYRSDQVRFYNGATTHERQPSHHL